MTNSEKWYLHDQWQAPNPALPVQLVLDRLTKFGYSERFVFDFHMALEECLVTQLDLSTRIDFLCQMNRARIYLRITDGRGKRCEWGKPFEEF